MSGKNDGYLLEMLNISKGFPGVQALDDVSFRLKPGEIHALLGENGAGKSTLMKILSGAYTRDSGQIMIERENVEIHSPADSLSLGIVTIYQESQLSLDLNVAENVFMGRLPKNGPFVQWQKLYQQTAELLERLDSNFEARTLVKNLSAAQRQMVEIAKALSMSAKVIVLDEPTASLTDREVDVLFEVMDRLRKQGVAMVFITHRLPEVFEVADNVTVLRDGLWVSTDPISDIRSEEDLVQRMVGRDLGNLYQREDIPVSKTVLRVTGLSGIGFNDVSFEIRSGEIVGMFGLVGSGRTDVARALFGANPYSKGEIEINDQRIKPKQPKDSIKAGIALVPEDRKEQGLVLGLAVKGNIALPNLRRLSRAGFMKTKSEQALAQQYKTTLDIRCPTVSTPAKSLSGGNQQKVVIAKWLAQQPQVLILDEPTRGIDVAGKAEVHNLMYELAAEGVGVLMVSSELPEILGMSDRVLIMHENRLVAEVDASEATEEKIMSYATGHVSQVATTG